MSSQRDYYNVLGVERTASADDVKRAYRRLAMRWHPDRNAGDQMAEARFKHVYEAYAVLSDAEERARYDRLGPLYQPNGQPPSPEDLSAVVSRVWTNLFGAKAPAAGDDLRYTVSVTLEEVGKGVTREVVVPRRVRCVPCKGVGARPEGRKVCETCHGTGKSSGARLLRTSCYPCEGRGYVVTQPCSTCSGEGRTSREEALVVKIPAGVTSGTRLRLAGRGDDPKGDGPAGDAFVIVDVAPHPVFRRRGEDLVLDLPLQLHELALGADVLVPTLEGTTTIRVPPGTPVGTLLRVGHRGLPSLKGSTRGDLFLEVGIEVPTELAPEERTRLLGWASTLPAERYPRRAALAAWLKDRS